jgi:hypothetical protein
MRAMFGLILVIPTSISGGRLKNPSVRIADSPSSSRIVLTPKNVALSEPVASGTSKDPA